MAQGAGSSNNYHASQQGVSNPEDKIGTPLNEGSSSVPEGSVPLSQKGKKKIVRKKSIVESVKSVQKGKYYFKLDQIGFKIRLKCNLNAVNSLKSRFYAFIQLSSRLVN